MSTIDNINTNIHCRVRSLQKIIEELLNNNVLQNEPELLTISLNGYFDELEDTIQTYEFDSIEIFKEYFQLEATDLKRQDLYTKYIKLILACNLVGKLSRIYQYLRKLNRKLALSSSIIADCFRRYEHANISTTYNDKIDDVCAKCGTAYYVEAKTSENICKTCGATEKLYGIIFEDEQFFFQEGQRMKHGKYDPTKHCRFWIDRIQAKESTEIPNEVITDIKRCIMRDNIWIDHLTCDMIRKYLKQLQLTTYNDHTSLIHKLITHVEPEQMTDHEIKLIYVYFGRIVQIWNKIKPDYKPNCPYHPYFIYKIIEIIIKDKKRRDAILQRIHLQSRDTLIENDNIWRTICEQMPEFTYYPTYGR